MAAKIGSGESAAAGDLFTAAAIGAIATETPARTVRRDGVVGLRILGGVAPGAVLSTAARLNAPKTNPPPVDASPDSFTENRSERPPSPVPPPLMVSAAFPCADFRL